MLCSMLKNKYQNLSPIGEYESDRNLHFTSNYLRLFSLLILQVLRTRGDKNRMVLYNLINCNDTDFDSFIQQLEKTNQQHIIEVLNRVKTDIVLAQSQTSAKEINFSQGMIRIEIN